MTNYYGGYNSFQQPQYQNFMQQNIQPQSFSTTFVSNIAEAIATKPDVTGKPLFFYNKAEEEIYMKQYDNTGNAPVKTYKLTIANNENVSNPIIDNLKLLDEKLNDIKTLLSPTVTEENDKRNRR